MIADGTLRFTLADSHRASDEWNFNCGPAAVCAAFNLTPSEVRKHMGDFEAKRYTNPSLMFEVLKSLKANYRTVYRSDDPNGVTPKVGLGLMRVQWGGPWTNPGMPMRVRYRQTHWAVLTDQSEFVFDINAMQDGGWLPYMIWASRLIPWLIKECVPKADGRWWPTHVIEILK